MIFSIINGLIAFTALIVGALSLKHKRKVNQLFFFFCLITFLWLLLWCILFNVKDEHKGLFIARLGYSVIVFIPSVFYHFVLEVLKKKEKLTLYIFYSLTGVFLISIWSSDLFVTNVYKYHFGFYPKVGKLHILHLLQLGYVVVRGFSLLAIYAKRERISRERMQKLYVLLGFAIYSPAAIDYLANYGIPITPPGVFFVISSMSFFAYAMLRYHLLDIKVCLTKIGIAIIGCVTIGGLWFLLGGVILPLLIQNVIIRSVIGGLLLAPFGIGIYFLLKYIISLEEKELLKTRFKWREVLAEMAKKTAEAKNLREVLVYTIRAFRKTLGVNLCAVAPVVEEKKDKRFFIIRKAAGNPYNPSTDYIGKIIPANDFLVEYINKHKKFVELGLIDFLLQKKGLPKEKREELERLRDAMNNLKIKGAMGCFASGELIGLVLLGEKLKGSGFSHSDREFIEVLTYEVAKPIQEILTRQDKIALLIASIDSLLKAIEEKDNYTREHSLRVKNMCTKFVSQEPAMKKLVDGVRDGIWGLEVAATLHDLGKIGIPDNILNKPGKLAPEEWLYIKRHPQFAVEIISHMEKWLGDDIISGIKEHQEHFNGTGYPLGKKGEDIHPYARIIHVVDAWDAMTSKRPYYKSPKSIEEVIRELTINKNTQFDPIIVDAFINFILKTHLS